MITQSFEEAISAAQQGNQGVDDIKQTLFAGPLRELKQMQSEWGRTHAELQGRIARARGRLQQAVNAGLDCDHVARLAKPFLDQLVGDGKGQHGILPTTAGMIDRSIALMEGFTARQLHEERHVWCAWPNLPSRIRDGIHAAESLTTELEHLVADGGQLQRLVENVVALKTGQAVA